MCIKLDRNQNWIKSPLTEILSNTDTDLYTRHPLTASNANDHSTNTSTPEQDGMSYKTVDVVQDRVIDLARPMLGRIYNSQHRCSHK